MIQIKKTLLTLVALLAVTTGAWADETLLLTIENKGNTSFYSGSKTFDDKVTVTFSNEVSNYGDAAGWYGGGTASLLTVAGINGYTITSCKFYTDRGTASTGYTVQGESPSVYLFTREVFTDANQSVYLGDPGITKIEVYGTAPSASSGPEVAWDKATKTGQFTMPGGNVTLEPEYYPQAALTAAPTAINDVPATTDGAIVKAGTVANIGSTETAQGTVMYYVSKDALDDAALLALAADQWTADVPTAEKLAQGKAYVYYYVRGNDSDTDEENFSDGDICAEPIQVTLGAAPTYAVTFAEGTDPNEWTADPNTGVVKGTPVTVTYTGSKKVIGVKAEKKAAAGIINPVVGQIIGSDGNNYAANATLPDGVTKVAMIAYVSGSNGLALALTDEGIYTWDNSSPSNNGKTAPEICSALNTSKPVTGGTWKLPSRDEWIQMFSANGGNEGSCTGLNTAIGNAGGTALQENEEYWSSSEVDEWDAWLMYLEDGNASWSDYGKHYSRCVRACLVF